MYTSQSLEGLGCSIFRVEVFSILMMEAADSFQTLALIYQVHKITSQKTVKPVLNDVRTSELTKLKMAVFN
jgi:hypothetical protein